MNDEVLILDNVGKTFSGFELEHISFSVKPNSIMGLIEKTVQARPLSSI